MLKIRIHTSLDCGHHLDLGALFVNKFQVLYSTSKLRVSKACLLPVLWSIGLLVGSKNRNIELHPVQVEGKRNL